MVVSVAKTNAESGEARQGLPVILSALAIALLSVFMVEQMRSFDFDIFERLMLAFGENGNALSQLNKVAEIAWGSPSGLANLCGFLIIAALATYLALKLPVLPRAFATASLLALTLLLQWNAWHLFNYQMHPVGFLAALAAGIGSGLYLRSREDRRRLSEAHYFELKLRNKELLDTRLALMKQDEMERRILAADLHDQVLNDLKQVVQRFETYVKEPDEETAATIRELTDQVMREIREVMDSLSPSVLEHLGMAAAIEDCLRRGAERAGFKVRFRSKVEAEDLDCLSAVEQGLLYRLVQESITNICKHAEAKTVRTTIENDADVLVIKVIDDGKGMDPAKRRADSRGMKYMRYRIELIGGTIAWHDGEDGKGTVVEIRKPLPEKQST